VDIACLVIFLVCIFYTSVGGMKAVMWTDTFQVRTPQSLRFAGVRAPSGYSLPDIYLVCIFYTSVGGMKAVMWTDTFQVRTMQSL
jgi:Na+/proline symporter